jgi:hypothetical protein
LFLSVAKVFSGAAVIAASLPSPSIRRPRRTLFNTIGHHVHRCTIVEISFTGKPPVRER